MAHSATTINENGICWQYAAVAHTLIVIGYHLHKNQSNYEDLGGNYFDRIHSDGLKRYLVKVSASREGPSNSTGNTQPYWGD